MVFNTNQKSSLSLSQNWPTCMKRKEFIEIIQKSFPAGISLLRRPK